MCDSFCNSLSLFILRFTFVELFKKKHKNKVGRDISPSLCKYQDHQDYWPIIYDKLKDLFTTNTHSFQDFSHKDICAYITSQTRKCTTPLVRRYYAKLTCDIHNTSDQTFWKFFNFYGFLNFLNTLKNRIGKVRLTKTGINQNQKKKKNANNQK